MDEIQNVGYALGYMTAMVVLVARVARVAAE